ncbi:MAG: VOC family protein [Gaiellaceae bacterium]
MRLSGVRLVVDDFDGALAFYRRAGLRLTGLVNESELRRIGHARFETGPGCAPSLELVAAKRSPEVLSGGRHAESPTLMFAVDDLDAATAALAEQGGTVVLEPREQNAGGGRWRVAQVRDPSGTLVELTWTRLHGVAEQGAE